MFADDPFAPSVAYLLQQRGPLLWPIFGPTDTVRPLHSIAQQIFPFFKGQPCDVIPVHIEEVEKIEVCGIPPHAFLYQSGVLEMELLL